MKVKDNYAKPVRPRLRMSLPAYILFAIVCGVTIGIITGVTTSDADRGLIAVMFSSLIIMFIGLPLAYMNMIY